MFAKPEERTRLIVLILRVALGILFLWSGISKLTSGFSAAGYLTNATSGPFQSIFATMAGSPVVDFLVVFGELGIGLALVLGLLLRFGCYSGSLMMLLFYLSAFPPEHGLIEEHIIYILVFALLASTGAGRYFGLDAWVEKQKWAKSKKWMRYLLG